MVKRLLCLLSLILITINSFGQPVTRQMTFESGSQVSFVFNRWNNFINGVTKNSFSRVKIHYHDEIIPREGWVLKVKTDDTDLSNYYGSEVIPLVNVTIQLTGNNGSATFGPITLTNSNQIIASGTLSNSNTDTISYVTITYQCGPDAAITNAIDGEYFLNLEFSLEKP